MASSLPLIVTINGDKVLEFHRDKSLTDKQLDDLSSIDKKLGEGFHVDGQFINEPNAQDKATFMANLLINALTEDNEANAAMACSYLATQLPDLKQVIASQRENQITIQLIFDQEYAEQTPLTFTPKNKLI